MKLYKVEYLGYCTVNKRLTNPMIPWVIAEIKKNNYHQQVNIFNFFIHNLNIKIILYMISFRNAQLQNL